MHQITTEGHKLRIGFDTCGSTLKLHGNAWTDLEVVGEDGLYYPATATLSDTEALVGSASVPQRRMCRSRTAHRLVLGRRSPFNPNSFRRTFWLAIWRYGNEGRLRNAFLQVLKEKVSKGLAKGGDGRNIRGMQPIKKPFGRTLFAVSILLFFSAGVYGATVASAEALQITGVLADGKNVVVSPDGLVELSAKSRVHLIVNYGPRPGDQGGHRALRNLHQFEGFDREWVDDPGYMRLDLQFFDEKNRVRDCKQ